MKSILKKYGLYIGLVLILSIMVGSVWLINIYQNLSISLANSELHVVENNVRKGIEFLDFIEYQKLSQLSTQSRELIVEKGDYQFDLEGHLIEGQNENDDEVMIQALSERIAKLSSFSRVNRLGLGIDGNYQVVSYIAYKVSPEEDIWQIAALPITEESFMNTIEALNGSSSSSQGNHVYRLDSVSKKIIFDNEAVVFIDDQVLEEGETYIVNREHTIMAYKVVSLHSERWLYNQHIVIEQVFDAQALKRQFIAYYIAMLLAIFILNMGLFLAFYKVIYKESFIKLSHLSQKISEMVNNNYHESMDFEKNAIFDDILVNVETMRTDILSRDQFIAEMAYYDTETGVGNVYLLEEKLKQNLLALESSHQCLVILFEIENIEDQFDAYGTGRMNQLYSTIVASMQSVFGSEYVFRKSDYTFAAFKVLEKHQSPDQSINQLLKKLGQLPVDPMIVPQIFTTLFPQDGEDEKALLKNLEVAMQLKRESQVVNYDRALRLEYEERIELENKLKRALERNEIKVVYQPLVCPQTLKVKGVEALVRWQMSDGRFVSPELFIGIAERIGMIQKIDQFVFEKTMAMLTVWEEIYEADFFVSINASPIVFSSESFIPFVKSMLEAYPVSPDKIGVEIIESSIIENLENANESIAALHEMGIKIALDDFGKGYSSLNYLRKLKIDKLKIDKDFVREMSFDKTGFNMIDSIIYMAHQMALEVVVEGVEEEKQYAYLKELNVEYIQGYYFSKPLEKHEISNRLLNHGKIDIS